MQRIGSILGALTLIALLPAGSALLQGCLQCGDARTFDLIDASGNYMICPGGEHVFETPEKQTFTVQIVSGAVDDMEVAFGTNDMDRVPDGFRGDNAGLGWDGEGEVATSCYHVDDPAPLQVNAEKMVRYELLVERVECGDE